MFTIDDRIRGLPTSRANVVAVHQSINAPHLAIPGKQAGLAQAFIVGLKGQAGYMVFVYLYLSEVGDCAVYVSSNRAVREEQYPGEEAEALGFVESMGFMMDDVNFSALAPGDQEELLRSLPVFQKEPKRQAAAPAAASPSAAKPTDAVLLGRFFSSF